MRILIFILFPIFAFSQTVITDTLWITDWQFPPQSSTNTIYNSDGSINANRHVLLFSTRYLHMGNTLGGMTLYEGNTGLGDIFGPLYLPTATLQVSGNARWGDNGNTYGAIEVDTLGTMTIKSTAAAGQEAILEFEVGNKIADKPAFIDFRLDGVDSSAVRIYNGAAAADPFVVLAVNEPNFIAATGNFGINTNTPANDLDIGGDIRFLDYGSGVQIGTATYYIGVTSTGDVIEVSTPSMGDVARILHTDLNTAVANGNGGIIKIVDEALATMNIQEFKVYTPTCSSGSFTVAIEKNGSSIGSVVINSGNWGTVVTTGITPTAVAEDDLLEVVVSSNTSNCSGLSSTIYFHE